MQNICDTKYYITEAGYKGIQQFKYKGGSSSILYEYIWSPLCNWIVDHLIPSSIAPNTITLVASLQMIATHFVILYYSPDFKTNLPTWLIVWAGISTLIYQILDNCDGKQARKTGSSSPLGMLFDHGCDSVITWILYLTMINVLQLGHNWIPYFCGIFISQISFYMAQWAQYHAGVFKLGYINAIDEGLVLVEANYIFTAIVGQQFWSNQIPQFYNFTYGETAMLATGLGAFIQCILFIFDAHKQDIEEIGIQKKGKAESLICVFWLVLCYYLVWILSPPGYNEKYGLFIFYAFGALFSKVTLFIQLSHLTREQFIQLPFSFVFITLFIVLGFGIDYYLQYNSLKNALIILYITIAMAVTTYLHMATCVSKHISDVLGIRVFSLSKPPMRSNIQFQQFSDQESQYKKKQFSGF